MEINKDFMKLLRAFAKVDVRYLLVGAFAVEFHGQPRTTRHMDLWLDDSAENMERVYRALVPESDRDPQLHELCRLLVERSGVHRRLSQ